ncbi:hypothetical protein M409DRAFT_29061 [Zasmidium cellare ATCC 36951]|uniref:UBZ4-type domain-containing protein n=1 Tax=Zasmidium cellare ATCC 36951 TaxID=1080233 RepID=A0A6A6C2D6_ZASCE|nr:uncharacterized protein M409DRAFT_29061 [Zasmidium cellare ATCC 36951]KAF2160438.1 hypothetical protein M409DRAFT_29061 [Zasmidium cellare ATCC 36951]
MNRPRNRQQRPNRGGGQTSSRGGQSSQARGDHSNNNRGQTRGGGHNTPRPPYPTTVPTTTQVLPGTSVSIVLKQDQPTGREVQGVVQDLLTRGNHPRGIKVRLSDGRVGRVQRMVGAGGGSGGSAAKVGGAHAGGGGCGGRRVELERGEDDALDGPPPRTLADYIQFPSSDEDGETSTRGNEVGFTTATAKCPICGLFEGDEIAVSRHAEEHFT